MLEAFDNTIVVLIIRIM